MSDLQDALDQWDAAPTFDVMVDMTPIVEAARRVANPDLDLAHRFDTMTIGGPTADGRIHLNGSLSNDEWGRLQAALGLTEDADA